MAGGGLTVLGMVPVLVPICEAPKVSCEVLGRGSEVPKVGGEVLVPNWKGLAAGSEVRVAGCEVPVAMMEEGVEEVGMVRREDVEDTLGREERGVKEEREGVKEGMEVVGRMPGSL